MAHRGIATLAAVQVLSFLVLSHLEPEFWMLHLYQSLIYLAVILLLFYSREKYAYMLGMLAPAAWLLLTYGTGLLSGAARQVSQLLHAQKPGNQVGVMAAVLAVLAVLMVVFCAYRWKREYAGLGEWRRTFLVGLGVVLVYYGILGIWFWRGVPQTLLPV